MKNQSSGRSRRVTRRLMVAGGLLITVGFAAKLYVDRRFSSQVSLLTQTLELKPGMTVADVGAGKGAMTIAVARRVGPQGRVYATEIDPKRIEDIRRALGKSRLQNVTVITGTALDTGLPEECCDAIFLRGVYHHLTQPPAIDRSLWKALRPGGYLAIVDFPPKLLLWPWRPKDVPQNRGGHGIPRQVLIDELTAIDFQVARIIHDWPGGQYCVLFRKPTRVLLTMSRDPMNADF